MWTGLLIGAVVCLSFLLILSCCYCVYCCRVDDENRHYYSQLLEATRKASSRESEKYRVSFSKLTRELEEKKFIIDKTQKTLKDLQATLATVYPLGYKAAHSLSNCSFSKSQVSNEKKKK